MPDFTPYPKTPRLFRDIVITEKIDGTNAAIHVPEPEDGPPHAYAQSRKRLITPKDDNFGFARWVYENAVGLAEILGPGTHFGEWWGSGIQRGYGLPHGEKRFSLFNTSRWQHLLPGDDYSLGDIEVEQVPGLRCVPVLYSGPFSQTEINEQVADLRNGFSPAALCEGVRFPKPEGLIVFHTAANQAFKVLCENDDISKTEQGSVRV